MGSSGLSQARLGRMRDVMAGYVERGSVPGLVCLVRRRGAVRLDAIGTLAFDASAPMRHDTIFRVNSMTKPVIAVATRFRRSPPPVVTKVPHVNRTEKAP